MEAEQVEALGVLHSLRSKKKLSAQKRQETHFQGNKGKETWIEGYADRETAVGRQRVQDTEIVIMQHQEHIINVEKPRSTITKPETTFEEVLNATWDSWSNLASSNVEEEGEDEDDDEEDTEVDKQTKDDEPGWVMGTMSKTVQQPVESFLQQQMRLDDLTQPGGGDVADNFRERDMKCRTTQLKVPAVVKPQTDTTAATP